VVLLKVPQVERKNIEKNKSNGTCGISIINQIKKNDILYNQIKGMIHIIQWRPPSNERAW
jgi:hypothetical protein